MSKIGRGSEEHVPVERRRISIRTHVSSPTGEKPYHAHSIATPNSVKMEYSIHEKDVSSGVILSFDLSWLSDSSS